MAESKLTFFDRWMRRRLPPKKNIALTRRRLFIFPSPAGWGFIATILLLLLAAINFQNSLIFLLCFLLFSIFVVSMHHAHANLSGVSVHYTQSKSAHVNEPAELELKLSCPGKRDREAISIGFKENLVTLSVTPDSDTLQAITVHSDKRGLYKPPAVLIESFYPLGLFRTWSWLYIDASIIIFPEPIYADKKNSSNQGVSGTLITTKQGNDEFYQLKKYRRGEPLKHIAWKNVAKGQPLLSKEYRSHSSDNFYLDWESYAGLATEQRLSALCYEAYRYHHGDVGFGLKLPGRHIEEAQGKQHLEHILSALALFDVPEAADYAK